MPQPTTIAKAAQQAANVPTGGERLDDTASPPRLGAHELSDLKAVSEHLHAADAQVKAATNGLAEARGAYRFVWGKLQERYGFTDADGVSLEDGTIHRVPTA